MSDDVVAKAQSMGEQLKDIREQELALRARRNEIREEWSVLYKSLKGVMLRDATQAYWDAQTGEEMLYVRAERAAQ